VDAFIGTNQINDILAVCDEETNTRQLPVVPLGNKSATYLYDEHAPRVLATPGYTAFIKIAEGCDRPCAFCAIPIMRGSFRSRRFGSVIAEAQRLAEGGVKELVLIAQDSTRYGEDLGMRDGLAQLLRELSRVDGIEWVRVMYAYPTHVSDAFLDVMAEEPKAAKYLDILCNTLRQTYSNSCVAAARARVSNVCSHAHGGVCPESRFARLLSQAFPVRRKKISMS
jgi:ribosomal protein S12 methylthiotransferase